MDIITRVALELRNTIPTVLSSLGGNKEVKPKLTGRLVSDLGREPSELEEIVMGSALSQEISSEIIVRLLTLARNSSMTAYPIERILDENMPKATLIVSLQMLSHLKKGNYGFIPIGSEMDAFVSLPFVGVIGAHEVFLDPYADIGNEALCCEAGWFNYSAGTVFYPGDVEIDPIEQVAQHDFYDDVEFNLDTSRICTLIKR